MTLTSLLVVKGLPEPPRGGEDLRNRQAAAALASLGPVTVFGLAGGPARANGSVAWLRASDRTLGTPSASGALAWLRDPHGHQSDLWFSEAAAAELAELVLERDPDVVVLATLWLHRYLPAARSGRARVVLDAQNLESVLSRELAAGRDDPLSAKLAERTEAIEAAAFAAVDQVWVCSERDARLAAELHSGAAPAAVVPNTVDVERYAPGGAHDGATLLYPGAFHYPPNAAAAGRLVASIFPAFAEHVPDARLVLLGRDAPAGLREAVSRDPRIELTGAVDDAAPWFAAASAMPVPLTEGGGTRVKVLEAFAARLPVVSTAKGVEGLELHAPDHYLRAETDGEFVEALVELCTSQSRRARLTQAAFELVSERHSTTVARERVGAALSELGVLES